MKLTLARIGKSATIAYAMEELARLLRRMDATLLMDCRVYKTRDPARNDLLWIGLDGSVEASPADQILIDIKNGAGIITGSNERAVLIAVYRFAHELGCRFLRPGAAGEIIPEYPLDETRMTISLSEKAASRHRGICIEGAVSYEHVYNMIDWIPKVGLNGYFMQFHTPSVFFKRFYNKENPFLEKHSVTDEDITHIWARLEEEIIKRGLNYHATGHGWTCEPFGISGTDWEDFKGEIPADLQSCLAQLDGKRQLYGNKILNTNLCYSNPVVRKKITDAIVAYCQNHPSVNFLHFWLADGKNNHCECDACQRMRPSDYYVIMLNELDRKLTATGINTKIVCLIYLDLLWEPETQKIENPDRFVLMFAPITRTYTTAFADYDASEQVTLAPYERNHLVMPKTVAENVARVARWQQEQLDGDSFDFDYHLMWDHYLDPGYYECARILHQDMANLEKIGLHGMVSCQTQRASFPTGLPMYAMAKALWNHDSIFTDVTREYYSAAFGPDADAVETYLSTLSRLFCPAYLRGEKPISADEMLAQCRQAKAVVNAFDADFIKKHADQNLSWKHLDYHADFCRLYANLLISHLQKDAASMAACREKMDDHLRRTEPALHEYLDAFLFRSIYHRYLLRISEE